jgi:D-alanine-D-alanine ligase
MNYPFDRRRLVREREVALSGARQIEKGLAALGHAVTLFDPARDLRGLYAAAEGHDFAFITCTLPRRGRAHPCLWSASGMPFQGSDSRSSLLP